MKEYFAVTAVMFVVCSLINFSMYPVYRRLSEAYREYFGNRLPWYMDFTSRGCRIYGIVIMGVSLCIPYYRWAVFGGILLIGAAFAVPKIREKYLSFILSPFSI